MPTENPRITITMSKEQLEEIKDYLHKNRLKNQTQAILSLINKGFEALNAGYIDTAVQANKKTSAPAEAGTDVYLQTILNCYNSMNKTGQMRLAEDAEILRDSGRYDKHSNIQSEMNA